MEPNPYITVDNHPALRPSLVLFADILGWSTRSRAALASNRGNAFLTEIKQAVVEAYARLREEGESWGKQSERSYQVKTFTDNIVLGMPLRGHPSTLAEAEIGIMAMHVAPLQLSLATRGFFLRGAVACGEHYMDDDFVFGDALLEAHDYACEGPPRIVMAPSIERLVRSHSGFYNGRIRGTPNYNTFLEDTDHRLFVDYLSNAFIALPHGPIFHDLLRDHANRIQDGLADKGIDVKLRGKFEWLARYHNFVCSEFADSYSIDFDEDNGEVVAMYEEAQKVRDSVIGAVPDGDGPTRMGEPWAEAAG